MSTKMLTIFSNWFLRDLCDHLEKYDLSKRHCRDNIAGELPISGGGGCLCMLWSLNVSFFGKKRANS